jgi:ketosteroid isomerase-like protein
LEKLFREYAVEFAPIVIDIKVAGELAVEHGWHQMKLFPKVGGEEELRRTRYVEVWRRDPQLGWRIVLFIDNRDQEPELMEEVLLQLAAASAPGSAQR